MIGPDSTAAQQGPVRVGVQARGSLVLARALKAMPTLFLALGVLLAMVLVAVFGPFVWRHSPNTIDILGNLQGPSRSHPMGTDAQGRDVLARFLAGARISLIVGFAIMCSGALLGGAVGILSALIWRPVDFLLMRVMDALLAFPPLILAMAVTIGLGTGIVTASIGIVLTTIPWYARLVRGDVLRLRAMPFFEAADALGASRRRLIMRHVVPHLSSTLLIQSASVFGYSIMALAGLGFVGLGAQIPTPEWGSMITEGLQSALTGQWWITVFPGLGLLVVVTAGNVLADATRDALDPHGRQKGQKA